MKFEMLVTKLLADPEFAKRFHKDKAKALTSIGIRPTQRLLKALGKVDYDAIGDVAKCLGEEREEN